MHAAGTSTLSNTRNPVWEFTRAVVHRLRAVKSEISWRVQGCPAPPPPHVKRKILRRLARRHGSRIMVETGTLYGETLHALRDSFDQLHSIELSRELYEGAKRRFAGDRKIHLWFGDSGEVLSHVLTLVDRPAMFWLDGHYSGGPTALGSEATPIVRELGLVSRHQLHCSNVVVIDDARLFDGTGDYPTLDHLRREAMRLGFTQFKVINDMIVLKGENQDQRAETG
jgi:hypothetical protein